MTGGTIPTNITQSVTFYNTAGIIEKHKNIYFVPFLTSGNEVRQKYLQAFNNKCLSNKDSYQNIIISSWSPEDKTLVVKGNVDDFRVITEEGDALNYFIITRVVTKGDEQETFYYAFFINDVRQVGGASIEITYEPDHFTNVFYLHNRETCTDNYEPFNSRLKNCFVERQHYDRVKISKYSEDFLLDYFDEVGDRESIIGKEASLTIGLIEYDILVTNIQEINHMLEVEFYSIVPIDISQSDNVEIQSLEYSCRGELLESTEDVIYNEANLELFSQIEESFKYKRQYRDSKKYLNYGDLLNEEESLLIKNKTSWSLLSDKVKKKFIKMSLAFLHITLNTEKVIMRRGSGSAEVWNSIPKNYLPNTSIKDNLKVVCLPISVVPIELKYYESFINLAIENIKVKVITNSDLIFNTSLTSVNYLKINEALSEHSAFASYVVSSYISRESGIINYINIDTDSITMIVRLNNETRHKEYPALVFLPNSLNGETQNAKFISALTNRSAYYTYEYSQEDNVYNYSFTGNVIDGINHSLGFAFVEDLIDLSFNINLEDKGNYSSYYKNNYYDVVLSFNPYSFYSLSYLGRIEQPLNKLNYYQDQNIKLHLTIHVTDVFKYSVLPEYTIDNLKQYFYSEGIEQTQTNQLTIITSKLADYVIANQAQMKNQYAVNDVQGGYGMVNAGIGLASSVGGGAIFGLAGAGLGLARGAGELIKSGLSWKENQEITSMNQKAKLADMGNLPSNLKQVGSDIGVDLGYNELGLYLNHYKIDDLSYNSICRYLERFGYMVNIYDSLNVLSRVGWNYLKLIDFNYEAKITVPQEEAIKQIFNEGVTLLHNENYFTTGHNFETILR